MKIVSKIELAQPGGLSLILNLDGVELRVRLIGGGLVAEVSAGLDRQALIQFFSDVATNKTPPWGRWEYKADDDAITMHARPDGAGNVLLAINLLASSADAADWQAEATLAVPALEWLSAADEVKAACCTHG